MKTRLPLLLALALACWTPPPAALAQSAEALGDGPLSLDAKNGFEWRRDERLLIAEGDAVARQADVVLKAERLVAAYREKPGGGLEIYRLDAEGAVNVQNKADTAAGTRASFDLDARKIVLTGPGLKYVSGAASVTANRSLEYDLDARKATARGDAQVADGRGRLAAPVIEARLADAPADGVVFARAWGGVVIRTAEETVRAERAEYDFRAQRAKAVGGVRIARGKNVLTGASATVDFRSGVSRLVGDGKGKRVKGLVFPQAQKN